MKLPTGAPIVLALVTFLGTPALSAGDWFETVDPRTVLTIHSGAEDFPSTPILDAGIRDVLTSRSDVPVDYFAEYLENDLFPEEEASQVFSEYLRRKYHGRRIDVVMAVTTAALRFALAHRDELFPDSPIVGFGPAGLDEGVRTVGGGVTGMSSSVAYAETLKLALTLHPSTERVIVVANGDEQSVGAVRAELADFSPAVSFTYLADDTLPRLLAEIKNTPPRSIILYIWHTQREPGHLLYPDKIAHLVAQAAPVPVYGTSDLYIGSGVVGGVVRGTRETGTRLGEMALRILTGTPAQDIPIETAQVRPVLDWRELQRWGISEARAPAGAVILFREPSVFDRYKAYILIASAALLAQTVLIVGLLIQRTKRRHAEEQVRGSYERIRDLGARLLNSQESERVRIARELHDDISQQVALLAVDLELLGSGEHPQADQLAGEALSRAHNISRSLHDLSHRLHPAKLRLLGLVAALQSVQHELSKTEIAITFTHDNVPSTLPLDVKVCLFRIVQEALQNAIKYSRAREVSMHLSGTGERLALTIVDDGVGFDVKAAWGKGLGLISMRERAEAAGGALEIFSKPGSGSGTRMEVWVPSHVERGQTAV